MKTIRRLIYREVVASVVFVAAGFLALFFFFDFVDELPNVGKGPADSMYKMSQALGYVTLQIPNHLYELLPIAVLIGTIFVMGRGSPPHHVDTDHHCPELRRQNAGAICRRREFRQPLRS